MGVCGSLCSVEQYLRMAKQDQVFIRFKEM